MATAPAPDPPTSDPGPSKIPALDAEPAVQTQQPSMEQTSTLDDDECFLCCEGSSRGTLVKAVCHCRDVTMHLHCQQKMLEYSYARGAQLLRCGVCHAQYRNADTLPVWRLSLTGLLWCTCPAGVAVMLWSATTVLDRGSTSDPKLHYEEWSWWGYQWHHLTWWRLIGLCYLGIALFMAIVALGWLIIDLCGRRATRALGVLLPEPICVRRRLVFTWRPEASSTPGTPPRCSCELTSRQWLAMLQPWTGVSPPPTREDAERATVLL